ncbi:DUF4097 family beta strand repeat protein [Lysinibacillus agricola]|uniref:DUF4097 family beta strand repeat protein n=1 Tax=Lysinibacillus agricola TaxID=2590012 RepID=A0ABX7AVK0_9BACI|nr:MULTISPECIES: DUF4097 family beta strand repeat-containing protein [Lysinibacillus]KOS63189.1 hypothetical protein AN161_08165 [Lysinibacillus sp. FJAT-14222]QQP12244.1 DUF4097 family beta strand repeat protein [Lysinibacillus agricola]
MKKAIIAFLFVIAIGGIVFTLKINGEKGINEQQSFDAQKIEELEINIESWDITLESTESEKLTIEIEGKPQNNPVEVKKDGNKIKVHQQGTEEGVMKNFSFGKKDTIHISIPKNAVNKIALKNGYGDIKINNIETDELSISTDSGAKIIKGLSANKGIITSKDDELSIADSSLNELTIGATKGDSYITGINSSKTKITSTSGEVFIKGSIEGKALFVETASGDITVAYKEAPKSLELIANSESSDISVNLEGYQKEKHTDQLKNGKIGDAANKLELISKRGVITVK